MNQSLSQHWDEYYDTGKDFGLITTQALNKMFSFINDNEKTFLDIGCGSGQLSRELFHRGYCGAGVDVSKSAIELAKSATVVPDDKLSYSHLDFEIDSQIELLNKKYSLVTTKLVYSFIKDKERFLKKVRTILLSTGTFVLITPTRKSNEPASKISVDFKAVDSELRLVFGTVENFDWVGQLTFFICKP